MLTISMHAVSIANKDDKSGEVTAGVEIPGN